MRQIHTTRRVPARTAKAAAILGILLGCLGLAACGGSSTTTTTSVNANAAAPTGTGAGSAPHAGTGARGQTGHGAGSGYGSGSGSGAGSGPRADAGPSGGSGSTGPQFGRFAALRECLQKNGVTLPKRTPGQRPLGGFLGGAAGSHNGLAQLRAALKKCGGFFGGAGRAARRFNSPASKQAIVKFAACMRENGVNVPEPNTSGKGPVFSTKGLNTSSPQFRAAQAKCRLVLRAAFLGGAGAASGGTG
jgi:hypothetical protein